MSSSHPRQSLIASPLKIYAFAILAIWATSSHAIEEIEVSITRQPGMSYWETPASIAQLSSEDLQHQFARSLPEALAEQSGVLVQKTANGQGSPYIRGFTGYRTLVLIDGVRYNNSVYRDGPNEYFSLIDINSIERLELLNGPATVLYGSDSIGGSLYLQTKSTKFQSRSTGTLFLQGAQHYRYASAEDSHQSQTELQFGRGERWGTKAVISHKYFGNVDAAEIGKQPTTGYDEHTAHLRTDIQLAENWALTATYQQLKQDDVWRTHSTIYAKSFAGSEVGSDLRRLKDQQRQLSYIKLQSEQYRALSDSIKLTLSHQRWQEDGDRIRSDSRRTLESFTSNMLGVDLQLDKSLNYGELTYGIEYYRDDVDSARRDFSADGSLNAVRIQGPVGDDSTFKQLGVYAQFNTEITHQLSITAGSRWSQVEAKIGRFEDPSTAQTASFNNHWHSVDNSLKALFIIDDRNLLWLSASQAFRAPNIADISRYGKSRSNEFEVAATSLSPEKFLSYEFGWRWSGGDLQLETTYHYTDIRDFITSTPTGQTVGGLTEVSKSNSSNGKTQGIDIKLNYQFSENTALFANSSWLEGELEIFDSTQSLNAKTEPMSRIMPVTTIAGVTWQPSKKFWLRSSLTYANRADALSAGDKADLQRIPPGGTPSYTLINLHVGYTFNEHVNTTFGIGNVLDKAYRTHGSGSNEPGLGADFALQISF